jgi:hypothetical protein
VGTVEVTEVGTVEVTGFDRFEEIGKEEVS